MRLPADVLARVDEEAAMHDETRAATMRRLLDSALASQAGPDSGVDRAQIRRMLALSPLERIRHAADVANGVARIRSAGRASR